MIRSLNQKAFTLIELMVTIALIALLSVMVVIGIGKLQTNSKRQQTMLTLENLRAMYADYDSVTRLHFPVAIPATNLPCPMNVTADANPSTDNPAASHQADDTTQFNRFGAAVWTTRDMMALLRQVPANAAALAKLSASSIMRMPQDFNASYPKPYGTTTAAWAAGVNYISLSYANDPQSTAQTSPALCSVPYTDPITNTGATAYYRCLEPHVSAAANQPPNTTLWLPVTSDDSVPILLDAWGNPILFVGSGTLGTLQSLTNNTFPGIDSTGTVHSGTGLLVAGGRLVTVSSPDGRPFFASAGPDGDFSKGDDNLYSFEK